MILYPEYKGDAVNWEQVRLPALDEKFIKELEGIALIAGKPRFRIVDGTRATYFDEGDENLPAGYYPSYTVMREVPILTGYKGVGEDTIYPRSEFVPRGVIALPQYEYKDFSRPRYVVEIYRDCREPFITESGYREAWTCEVLTQMEIDGHSCEVSLYRHPSNFDLAAARELANRLENRTAQSLIDDIRGDKQKREKSRKDADEERTNIRDEKIEKFIVDLCK